jgi:hypothetical protein
MVGPLLSLYQQQRANHVVASLGVPVPALLPAAVADPLPSLLTHQPVLQHRVRSKIARAPGAFGAP